MDVNLTEKLLSEGLAKEIVNRIQNMRKSKNYNVTDRINVSLSGGSEIHKAIDDFQTYIESEVLADQMKISENISDGETFELTEGIDVKIAVMRS